MFVPKPIAIIVGCLAGLWLLPFVAGALPLLLILAAAYVAYRFFDGTADSTPSSFASFHPALGTMTGTTEAPTAGRPPERREGNPFVQDPVDTYVPRLGISSEAPRRKNPDANDALSARDLDRVVSLSNELGFELLPAGLAAARVSRLSGYSVHETVSYIALHTFAHEAKHAWTSASATVRIASAVPAVLQALEAFYLEGLIRRELFFSDRKTMTSVVTMNSEQGDWIRQVLDNSPAGAERLARRR